MKVQDQVCTFEQAKRLQELGVIQEGENYFAYIKNICHMETEFRLIPVESPGVSNRGYSDFDKGCLIGYAAFTVNESEEIPEAI